MKKPTMLKCLLPALVLWLVPGCSMYAADFNRVGKEMVRILKNGHYAKLKFDDTFSQRIFEKYLDELDPARLYFEKKDVEELQKKYGDQLDDLIDGEQSMVAAKEIYDLYRQRVEERSKVVEDLLKEHEFVFDRKEAIQRDREDAERAEGAVGARELWRLQIKEALLSETLRRDGIQRRAKEQGKKDPFRNQPDVKKKISQRYQRFFKTIQGADDEDIANYFLSAVARSYDPHSEYFSARELQQFQVGIQNKLVGIGALLRAEDDGATKIEGIVNNGPADKQGELKLKDRVIGVDSKNSGEWIDIMFMPLDKVVEKIRGEKGVDVALKVEPAGGAPGETKIIVIKREEVTMKDELATAEVFVFGEGEDAVKLGVIKIPSFYFDPDGRTVSVSRDVEKLLERLKKEKIDGLAIDLRGNGGGSLEEVKRMTGFFVGGGPVVQIKKTNGFVRSLDSPIRKAIYDGPMLVWTDKGSASASEILAGALQDYNRAVIIGESSTFGKGTVQQPLGIARYMPAVAARDRAGAVKLTIQQFYRVAGSSTQKKGVEPDIVLPSMRDALEIGEKYAEHALEHDTIQKARNFEPLKREGLFLPKLMSQSEKRVKVNRDFQYTVDDTKRLEERLKKNEISLNKKEREVELAESEDRRRKRNVERRKRFAEIEKKDGKEFELFRLTLDDLHAEVLPKVDREKDAERHMRVAEDEVEDLDDTPEWPSGIDPTKREGLAVLRDLVKVVDGRKVARLVPNRE